MRTDKNRCDDDGRGTKKNKKNKKYEPSHHRHRHHRDTGDDKKRPGVTGDTHRRATNGTDERNRRTKRNETDEMPTYRRSERAFSRYNNNPGSGSSGFHGVAPNGGYDFYDDEYEKYAPVVKMPNGEGVVSEWTMGKTREYDPTREEYLRDVDEAKAAGVPLGAFIETRRASVVKTMAQERVTLTVRSLMHADAEYGGPFEVTIAAGARVHELKKLIADKCGVLPGLQCLSYAGKRMEDPNRTLLHMGVRYWNARFPRWPVTILRR